MRKLAMLLVFYLALVTPRAHATEAPNSTQVVLGVFAPGKSEERVLNESLTRVLTHQLDLTAEPYRLARRILSVPERACRTLECLVQLARAADAQRLLGADLITPTPQMTTVKLWIFDARTHQTAEEELRCETCDETRLAKQLSDGINQFIGRYPQGTPIQTSIQPLPPVIPTPGLGDPATCPDPQAACIKSSPLLRKQHTRHVTGAVLGGALVATLSLSIAAAVMTSEGGHLCTLSADNTHRTCADSAGVLAAGFGTSGALTLGIILSLALPVH